MMKIIVIAKEEEYEQFIENLDNVLKDCPFHGCTSIRCKHNKLTCGECIRKYTIHVEL